MSLASASQTGKDSSTYLSNLPPATSLPAALFGDRAAAQQRNRIDRELKQLARENLFSGVVLIAKDDKVLFQGAYGLASREYDVPNAIDTKLNLASAGKMFTTVAIGALVERGAISLDDAVSKYLDASWIEQSAAVQITIANLLSHTSGMPDYFTPNFLEKSRTLFKKVDDYKPQVSTLKPTFTPGTQYSYSNTNFLLLGAIIEKATGETYDNYLKKVIFEPCGMSQSGSLDLENVNRGYAQGYAKLSHTMPQRGSNGVQQSFREIAFEMADGQRQLAKAGFTWQNNVFMHVAKGEPSGGSYSTAPDLLKFANALTSGKLITPAMLARLTSANAHTPEYGYGFQLMDGGFGHTGGFPGISTSIVIYPDGYRLIVISNVDGGSAIANAKLIELSDTFPLTGKTVDPL